MTFQTTQASRRFDRSICRRRVRVWWSAEGKWFAGKVTTLDPATLCHIYVCVMEAVAHNQPCLWRLQPNVIEAATECD